jgi:hypothetical protein
MLGQTIKIRRIILKFSASCRERSALKTLAVALCTTSLKHPKIVNTAFDVFVCFVCILEQTVTICLYNINFPDFKTDT